MPPAMQEKSEISQSATPQVLFVIDSKTAATDFYAVVDFAAWQRLDIPGKAAGKGAQGDDVAVLLRHLLQQSCEKLTGGGRVRIKDLADKDNLLHGSSRTGGCCWARIVGIGQVTRGIIPVSDHHQNPVLGQTEGDR